MKLTLEPTARQITVRSADNASEVPARIWEGRDEHGVPVVALITLVAVRNDQPEVVQQRFGRELSETRRIASPDGLKAFPMRTVL